MGTIITPSAHATVGQIIRYHCDKCGDDTVYFQADPGLTTFIFQCRAAGQHNICGGAMVRAEVWPAGAKGAPKPTREFFRPVSVDLRDMDTGARELIERGLLDERALSETRVKLTAPGRLVPRF